MIRTGAEPVDADGHCPYRDPQNSHDAWAHEKDEHGGDEAHAVPIETSKGRWYVMVLLKNEGDVLPLRKSVGRIAVIGPNADDGENQLGVVFARLAKSEPRGAALDT